MVQININQYLIKGGKDFNSTPQVIGEMPKELKEEACRALQDAFDQLDGNGNAQECFIDLPVNNQYRMFVRQYWWEEEGERPVSNYVGSLINQATIQQAGGLYNLDRALVAVNWETIQEAAENANAIVLSVATTPPLSGFDASSPKISFPYVKTGTGKDFAEQLQKAYQILLQDEHWFVTNTIQAFQQQNEYSIKILNPSTQPPQPMPQPTPPMPSSSRLSTLRKIPGCLHTVLHITGLFSLVATGMICYSLGQSELESFKQEVTTLSGKLKKAENDLHQKNKEIADLKKGESKKLQSIRRENVSLKKQMDAEKKKSSELEKKLKSADQKINDQQKELDALKKKSVPPKNNKHQQQSTPAPQNTPPSSVPSDNRFI